MHKPSPIELICPTIKLGDADFTNADIADKKDYKQQLKHAQQQLHHIQRAFYHQGNRALIILEGWDASGKGGAIRRVTEKLDPRGIKVIPIAAPTAEEQGRHYLYRFQKELPKPGAITVFDRSYFGRVLVERVEGFASEEQWQRGYQEINEFERLLVDDGVRVIKIFLHITAKEQLKRFEERLNDPYKRWKITHEDIRNREKWPEYETAINDMLAATHTKLAPWTLIPANKKRFTRVAVIETINKALSDGLNTSPRKLAPDLIKSAEKNLGIKVK